MGGSGRRRAMAGQVFFYMNMTEQNSIQSEGQRIGSDLIGDEVVEVPDAFERLKGAPR